MTVDVGTIQYNIEANTTGLDRANEAIDEMKTKMQQAGNQAESMSKKTSQTGNAASEMAKKTEVVADAMGGVGDMASAMGFQLQDAVVQLMGGADAALVFSQQGSQLTSVIHPLLGLATALAGIVGGALYAALTDASSATDGLSEQIKELHKTYQDLDFFQQSHLVNDEIKKQKETKEAIKETQKEIEKLTQKYNDLYVRQGKSVAGQGVSTMGSSGMLAVTLKDVQASEQKLISMRALLSTQNDILGESEKEIQRIRGIDIESTAKLEKQANDLIKSLREETETYGLLGRELGIYTAEKLKASDAAKNEIVRLFELREAQRQQTKDLQEAARKEKQDAQEAERIIKKRIDDENRRIESIKKMTAAMQREADLFGVTSKAAKLEYDIKLGLIDVIGGLAGAEAQLMLVKARRIDQMNDELLLAQSLDREIDESLEKQKKMTKEFSSFSEDALERINGSMAGAWAGFIDGGKDAFDGVKNAFKQTLAEMAHEAVTKPILLNIQQSMTGGATSAMQGGGGGAGSAMGAMGGLGIYAAAAIAVVAAVGIWNKKQDEKFVKMAAEYKQANQGMSKILGEGNKKSETIGNSIDLLKGINDNVLDVNYEMLRTLQDIRTGIGQTAAGFAKTLIGGADYKSMGIAEGSITLTKKQAAMSGLGDPIDYDGFVKGTGGGKLDTMVASFLQSIADKFNNAVYKKKSQVIDSGISIIGNNLADIMTGITLEAVSYADVKTTKKVFGINAGSKVKRATEELEDLFEKQISGVFAGAGDALKLASGALGIDFYKYINQLQIKTQDLSLKGLTGDALTKEIESFFGATLDSWADVLLSGTNVLMDFQKVGESSFDTMLRLSAQTNIFNDYANKLSLNFRAVGMDSVYAAQKISELSGGFEKLQSDLASYYDKFYDGSAKLENSSKAITAYFNDLGLAVPKTREQFKSLVESLDLTTASGQEQFSSLIAVNGAIDDYIGQIKKQRLALADNSFSSLQRAVGAQKKIIDEQINHMKEAVTASKAIYDTLGSTLDGLVIDSRRTQESTRKQAQQQLGDMLNTARAGTLPDADLLSDALSVISRPSENLYRTFEEYATDFYYTSGLIKDLQDVTGVQLTTEEKALAEMERQSTALDNLLAWGKEQLDILNGIDVSVISVADALNAFSASLGIITPVAMRNDKFAALAADGTMQIKTSDQQIAEQQAQKKVDEANAMMKDFYDFVKSSQFAIATNTDKIFKVLDKFDVVGMPPERAP